MPFSPFSSSARSLKLRGTCATAMIAVVGEHRVFSLGYGSVVSRESWRSLVDSREKIKFDVCRAQVLGAGVGGA